MNGLLAQADEELVSFFENTWHEQYRFSFGEWIDQFVRWGVNNSITKGIGDVIAWPFRTLFDLVMSGEVGRDSINTIPWIWLIIAVFVVASFTRNTRVGLACAAMLSVCPFLGAQYWQETATTIGLILVSVTLCTIVGVPLGILAGRFDPVWNVVRPTLDAMQVVHSFVFMLPFIFFYSIGNVSATMVTMVFALPPIVRLTNLGIRQVPEDVVEASRAYGATELRVLTDVQLPLARPAIMTGLNQTLLLAISMLGIAALMGAGGLGKLLFRAINNLDLGLAASAGLAFFLVAVVLDRITQTEAQDDVGLLTKLRQAWEYRANPAGLLEAQEGQAIEADSDEPAERSTPVEATERMGLLVALVGGAIAIFGSVAMNWSTNAGVLAAWSRFADEARPGESFSGISASGGSLFGWLVVLFGIGAIIAAVRPMLSFPDSIANVLRKGQGIMLAGIAGLIAIIWVWNTFFDSQIEIRPGTFVGANDFGPLPSIALWLFAICVVLIAIESFVVGTPRMGADGVLLAGFAMVALTAAFAVMGFSEYVAEDASRGSGVMVALLGSVIVLVGGLLAVGKAPYGPRRPLPTEVSWTRLVATIFALLLIVGSAFGIGKIENKADYSWLRDGRLEAIERSSADVPPDIEAEIARLKEEAGDDINKQIANAQEITNLINSVRTGEAVIHNGVSEGGPKLGWLVMIMSAAAIAAAIPASGLVGSNERLKWQSSVVMAGLGLGIMMITAAFTMSLIRVADDANVLTSIGTFMTFIAGFVVFASGRSVIGEFRRKKLYRDVEAIEAKAAEALLNLDAVEKATVSA